MADRRRRRRRASQDSEEEDESASGSEGERPCSPGAKARVREPEPVESPSVRVVKKSDDESECESEDGVGEAVLSDYESADPEENGSHSEGGEEDEDEPEEDASRPAEVPVAEPDGPVVELEVAEAEAEVKGVVVVEEEEEEEVEEEEEEEGSEAVEKEAKTEDKSNLAGERQSGDGQESTDDPENKGGVKTGQKLDDDEDRKNPAYIPRKGLFFEHDVRGQTQEEERPKGRHRKLWKDEGRWEHDRFREEEQAPKSRDELVAYYGYDIRNGTGPSEGRQYRPRKPRHGSPPSRDKRYRDLPLEKFVPRSWQGARSAPPLPGPQSSGPPHGPSHPAPSGPRPSAPRVSSSHPAANLSGRGFQAGRPQQQIGLHRGEGRGERGPNGAGPRSQRPQHVEGERGPRLRGTRGPGPGPQSERSPSVVVEDVRQIGEVDDDDLDDEGPAITMTTTFTSSNYSHYSKAERDIAVAATAAATAPSLQFSRRQQQQQDPSPSSQQQQQQQQRGTGSSGGGGGSDFPASSSGRDSSPPPERPVERKSYSAARRTRVRPADMGKQASLDEPVLPQTTAPPAGGGGGGGGGGSSSGGSGGGMKGDHWQGGQGESGAPGPLTGLDQDLARLSLAGQNWAQSPPSYLRTDLRGIPSSMHMGGAPPPPPPYANMDEMGVGGGRAKRYSSQRQRPVPEPAPLHIGVMEGHYYEPMSYQGPIYAHGDSPAPIPPQGMLVQPEMHLPHPGHPGLHPHQSGGPMPNPALYAAPPVSMSPGQPPPQQLMAAPFYPPPGVMTFSNTNFPYSPGATLPPMYPNPQAQSQVYGGVTYYDTVQQQAQPKPSPPRRSSQPVTVKPPPPEDRGGKQSEEVRS